MNATTPPNPVGWAAPTSPTSDPPPLFNVTNIEGNDFEELPEAAAVVVKETKAGYKTTEFWITVVAALAVVFDGLPAPESKEGYIAAGLAAVYAVARGLAKKGVPLVEPK